MNSAKITRTTADDIERALPKNVRPFVRVTCRVEPHEGFPQLCRAIGEAFRRFEGIPFRWREIDLCVSDDPVPTVITPAAALCLVPKEGIQGFVMGDIICLRADLLLSEKYALQVIAVAEELTHSLLNVRDENLATWIVTFLCPDLAAYRDGAYAEPEGFSLTWPPGKKDWTEVYDNKEFDVESCKRKPRAGKSEPGA